MERKFVENEFHSLSVIKNESLDITTFLGCSIISLAVDIHILHRAVGGECFEKRKEL